MGTPLLQTFRSLIVSFFLGSAPPPALENDDVLEEILIRLPPLPSSLLRVSLVCKHWRRKLSDPGFLRRFRAHHGTPPLLGYFDVFRSIFTPLLDRPDRIPRERFSLPEHLGDILTVISFRHGLAFLLNQSLRKPSTVSVWEPITCCLHTIDSMPEPIFDGEMYCYHGAVLRDGNGGSDAYVPSNGCSSPFKAVLTRMRRNNAYTSVFTCVYESESRQWSKAISIVIPLCSSSIPSVLVGNVLYGFFVWPGGILELDLDTRRLGVVETPQNVTWSDSFFRVVRTEHRGPGLAIWDSLNFQVWGRMTDCLDGEVGWMLQITIDLNKHHWPKPFTREWMPRILGFDEESNTIHLALSTGVFMIQLDSLQFTKLSDHYRMDPFDYYPYSHFYALGARRCLPG